VEDNELSYRVAARLLEKRGCSVEWARGGREALERLRSARFDAVLMDLQMPELDGFATTLELRRLEAELGRRTPVVVLTASALPGERDRALGAGADAFLTKPIDAQELVRTLSALHPPARIESR
jgi:CheY-like chemotaxis protein